MLLPLYYKLEYNNITLSKSAMQEIVQHIDIPFDEVGVFKSALEEEYQNILIETLLLTTLGIVHKPKKDKKYEIYVTTKSIWIGNKTKPKSILPLSAITGVIKSFQHPEIVILSQPNYPNIRIITSSEERCWYIISAICYTFTYIYRKNLCFISIKSDCLEYFECTRQDKIKGSVLNLSHYPKQLIAYEKPFKDITNIFGNLRSTAKIILEKQIEIHNTMEQYNHIAYEAKIKQEDHEVTEAENGSQNKYICHYIDKSTKHLQLIFEHKNIDFINKLVYAKKSEFKIQLFFQFSQSLYESQIKTTPKLFKQLWELYDKAHRYDKSYILTTHSIAVVKVKSKSVRKQSEELTNQSFEAGQYHLEVKQFRYDFLNETTQWDRFIYQQRSPQSSIIPQEPCGEKQSESETSNTQQQKSDLNFEEQIHNSSYLLNKMYNIGLILYELTTGRNLFSYTPAYINEQQELKEQTAIICELKKSVRNGSMQLFPLFLCIEISPALKGFIQALIRGSFESERALQEHLWLKQAI